jgi:hypothetical protein
VKIPLPWERLLWSGRPRRLSLRGFRERYVLTDFRLARISPRSADELALSDIADIHRVESRLDRLLGTSSLRVEARAPRTTVIELRHIRDGVPLAALLELLSGDPDASLTADDVRLALEWTPRAPRGRAGEAIAGLGALLVALFAIAIGFHGTTAAVAYSPDDPIAPAGVKRPPRDIAAFMETAVMPWARQTLGPLKGGADRITCGTCHGPAPEARGWQMPAVAALPVPDVRDRGWETYGASMDAQMRNAIYGYAADSGKQSKATYMREVVVPGIAALLHRPAYDFTQSYDYNRSRQAIGCYHCHRVK